MLEWILIRWTDYEIRLVEMALTILQQLNYIRNNPDSDYLMELSLLQIVHEIRNYPYPQLHLLTLQGLNPSRHATAVRESYEVRSYSVLTRLISY